MASESLYLIHPKAKKRTVFDEPVAAQKASRDLVIFSALAGQVVRVAWPSYKGLKIRPSGIREWLRARGLHWACFCGMTAPPNVHLSSRIVHSARGVHVYCHHEASACKFFLNLSDLYEITNRTSDYPTLPKLGDNQDMRGTADLMNFHISQLAASEMAPFLKDFCGDFTHGVDQLAGSVGVQGTVKTTIRRNPRSNGIASFAAPIASTSGPSTASTSSAPAASNPGPDTPHQRLLDQRELLDQLAEGEGIPVIEWEGLFEKCYVCDKYMLEAVFKAHNRVCWHMSDEESELEDAPDEWGKY